MSLSHTLSAKGEPGRSTLALLRQLVNVCKLRIGVTIAFTALAGAAVSPGPALPAWQLAAVGLLVLLAAAGAGGINQYLEVDLDRRMGRTRGRPFVSGELAHRRGWLFGFMALVGAAVAATAWVANPAAALYVLAGALTYAGIYTVWLKRRTALNIVIGGLAGSFAVLAGAAAVDPALSARAWVFALVLFLWTPSHFWSLAVALHADYAAARVPMLPVLIGDRAAARVILLNSAALVAVSLLPALMGLGWVYLLGAAAGGAFLLWHNLRLLRRPGPRPGMASFHASLVQLTLVLTAAMIDAQLAGTA